MSTFTRLYFVNRGPSIAEDGDQDGGEPAQVGSPGLAPVDSDRDAASGRDGETPAQGELFRDASLSPSGPAAPASADWSFERRLRHAMRRDVRPDDAVDLQN